MFQALTAKVQDLPENKAHNNSLIDETVNLSDAVAEQSYQPAIMGFGMNILFKSGAISDALMQKLKSGQSNEETMRLMSSLEMDHVGIAREIVNSNDFCKKNGPFMASGQAVRLAIERGHTDFADELINLGFTLPKNLLVDAIRDGDEKLIHRIIICGFYIGRMSIEVEFWYLIQEGHLNYAKALYDREKSLQSMVNALPGRVMNYPEDARNVIAAEDILDKVLEIALNRSLDFIASLVLSLKPTVVRKEMLELALKRGCMEFLRKVWVGNHNLQEGVHVKKRATKSVIWEFLNRSAQTNQDKTDIIQLLDIQYIMDSLLRSKKVKEAHEILDWPGVCDELSVVKTLVKYGHEDLAQEVLSKRTMPLTEDDLQYAIEEKQYSLAVDMLKFPSARPALYDNVTQERVINLLENGETCLPAIELLNRIPNKHFCTELIKNVVNNTTNFVKRTDGIVVCPAPLLYCVLVAECLQRLASLTLQYENRCAEGARLYLSLAKRLENEIPDENELRYYVSQKDSMGRMALSVMSQNRYYKLLENDDIKTIVYKMWNGPKRNHGIISASTLCTSFRSPSGSEEAMNFSKGMDKEKPYMFHFEQWRSSCSLRYMGIAFSTICLLIFYSMVVYKAIASNSFEDVTEDAEAEKYLRVSQFWVLGIILEQVQQFMFGWKTGRGYRLNVWRQTDFVMLAVMIVLMLDLHKELMGDGKVLEDWDPIVFNACLHSAMLTIQWVRIAGVTITSRYFGPFLRMIYLITINILNFLFIYLLMLICFAGVFTAMFNEANPGYIDFSTSVRSLFVATLNVWDIFAFTDHILIGTLMLSFWEILSQIILLNILIALLSDVYGEFTVVVSSEHSSVVIDYYTLFHWDDRYGSMLFLPSPLTYVTTCLTPLLLCKKDPRQLNLKLTKLFYFPYALIQFFIFLAACAFYLPLLFIKGFVIYGKTGKTKPRKGKKLFEGMEHASTMSPTGKKGGQRTIQKFNVVKSIAWLFIGIPWLLWAVIRDSRDFWNQLYAEKEGYDEDKEFTKIQQVVNEKVMQDIQMVLKNIKCDSMSVQQFAEMWEAVDSTHANLPNENFLTDNNYTRKDIVLEYLHQFGNSVQDPNIDINRMRMVLPRMPGKTYSNEYIKKAWHVNLHWFVKGIRKFHDKVGSVNIAGLRLPKELGVMRVKQEHITEVDQSIYKLQEMYEQVTHENELLRDQFRTQRESLHHIIGDDEISSDEYETD